MSGTELMIDVSVELLHRRATPTDKYSRNVRTFKCYWCLVILRVTSLRSREHPETSKNDTRSYASGGETDRPHSTQV